MHSERLTALGKGGLNRLPLIRNQQVIGSIPIVGSNGIKHL